MRQWRARPENLKRMQARERERSAAFRKLNPEKSREYMTAYMRLRRLDPEVAAYGRESAKRYAKTHRAELSEKQNQRRRTNPQHRIVHSLRERIRAALDNRTPKSAPTMELLGCTIDQFLGHLELQFQEGMSWSNYGDWHIDHRNPCAAFDLANPEQQRRCFHYSNLQPLWAEENLTKQAKITTII